ncbi:MAG TPA: CapA family protein [Microthrixaceae bacterium]|nr:CapA family protein [Microthrixaceae bacterium]
MRPRRLHRTVRGLLVLGAVALAAAACAGTDGTSVGAKDPGRDRSGNTDATSDTGASRDTAATTTTTTRPPTGSGQAVTLAFAGDTNFNNQLGALRSSPGTVLSAIAPTLSAADVTMLNLEAALGTGGSPQPKKFTFQVPAQAIDAVKAAGVDVVTMANNHGMDFGPVGFADSLRIERESGFPILGIGADDTEAYTPWVTEAKGQRIGFIGANDIFDDNLRSAWTAAPGHPGLASAEEAHQERLAQEVRTLRPEVDTLVVFLHYGTETQLCPNARQKELVELLTGAGADIVVGSHPHRLQGVGYHGQQFVAYSLGNFAFQANSPEGAATGVLMVTATGRRIDGYTWTPAVIRSSIPHPLTGTAADAAQATMTQRQQCAGLTPQAS